MKITKIAFQTSLPLIQIRKYHFNQEGGILVIFKCGEIIMLRKMKNSVILWEAVTKMLLIELSNKLLPAHAPHYL